MNFSWRPVEGGGSLRQPSQHQNLQDWKCLDLGVNALGMVYFGRKLCSVEGGFHVNKGNYS